MGSNPTGSVRVSRQEPWRGTGVPNTLIDYLPAQNEPSYSEPRILLERSRTYTQ